MSDIEDLKSHFLKLKRAINSADFSLIDSSLIKKNRIDDIFCCILAVLPKSFKTEMVNKLSDKKYTSIMSFNRLSLLVKTPFFFSKNYYIFNTQEALGLINTICKTIEKDLELLEKI